MAKTSIVRTDEQDRIDRIRERQGIIEKIGEAVRLALGRGVQLAIEIGEELAEQKKLLPHGSFMPWLKDHAMDLGFSPRTARRYLQMAANKELISEATDINSAIRLLAPPKEHDQTEEIAKNETDDIGHDGHFRKGTKRAYAIEVGPDRLGISKAKLAVMIEWYEGEFRAEWTAQQEKKPKKAKRGVPITGRIPKKMKTQIEREAKRQHITQSELIKMLLDLGSQQLKHEQKGGGSK